MSELNRNFKGVWIPKELWLDENITKIEMLFLTDIDSLDNDKGCFAMNEHFEKFFRLSKSRCSEIISNLCKKGYISIEYQRKDQQIIGRTIRVKNKYKKLPLRETEYPPSENTATPLENTIDINTYNNTQEFSYENIPTIKKQKTISGYLKEQSIIDYWKSKNTNDTAEPVNNNKTTLDNIKATINQYSIDELKNAIDGMFSDQWSIDNKEVRLNRLIKPDKRSQNMFKYKKTHKPTREYTTEFAV